MLTQVGIPYIRNIILTNANTEYAVDLGVYTKKFCIQNRGNGPIKVSYAFNKSGTEYFTIKDSAAYYEDMVHGPIIIYLQSPNANTVVEIITYVHVD